MQFNIVVYDIFLLAFLFVIGFLGTKTAEKCLKIGDPKLSCALGLPIGLSFAILAVNALSGYMPLFACIIVSLIFAVALIYTSSDTPPYPREVEPFSKGMCITLGILVFCCIFYLHASQLAHPQPDFWISYPLTRSILQHNLPPVHPFYPDINLKTNISQELLIAALSLPEKYDTLRTQWILELVMMLNSIFLWVLLFRQAQGRARSGVIGAILVFMGVNVGGRTGLMDAYDCTDLLVFLLLACSMSLLVELSFKTKGRWPIDLKELITTSLILSIFSAVCSSYYVLLLVCFAIGNIIIALRHRIVMPAALKLTGLVLAFSFLFALMQKSPLHYAFFERLADPTTVGATLSTFELGKGKLSQTLIFPKKEFMQIRLGVDPYQRVSSALNTALFRRYQPVLDDGGLSSIFGKRVLILHWIPTWLAPLSFIWVIYRKDMAGITLGIYGILAYLTPGAVDFGSLRESEYLRWEFVSGVAFAGMLGVCLSDAWTWSLRYPKYKKTVITFIVFLICADLVGSQRLINNIIISLQKDEEVRGRIASLWYPATEDWFLSLKELEITPGDLTVSRWLWSEKDNKRRSLNQKDACQSSNYILREAALAGLAGTLPVGHALNPKWEQANYPSFPAEPVVVFRQTGNLDVLAGLGVNWLIVNEKLPNSSGIPTEGKEAQITTHQLVTAVEDRNTTHYIYRLNYPKCPSNESLWKCSASKAKNDISVNCTGIPNANNCQAGIAYPLKVTATGNLKGWIAPIQMNAKGFIMNCLSPATSFIQGKNTEAWFVPSLEEGKYTLGWIYSSDGSHWSILKGRQKADYLLSLAIEESLRIDSVEYSQTSGKLKIFNVSSHSFDAGPLKIQLWVWDPFKHNYRAASKPEAEVDLPDPIAPQSYKEISWSTEKEIPNGWRLDFTASAKYGPYISVPRR